MEVAEKWAPWRRAGRPAPGSDMSAVTELELIDVTLRTEVAGRAAEVPRLGLAFNEGGMTVRKADGQAYARIPWQLITELSAKAVRPPRHSTATAVALDVQSSRKLHHFLVPNVQLVALTGSLGAMSQRYSRGSMVLGGKGPRH